MTKALILGGGTGLLGQALAAAALKRNWEISTLGRQDGNITDINFLESSLEEIDPDLIFNAIAWTAVDAAEDEPEEALALNRSFPNALAYSIAKRKKGFLIHYSTDFVFTGTYGQPFKESDPPRPSSVYGQTKLAGEETVLTILPNDSCIIRTAWLFGPGRKNFISTILNACQQKDTVSVVDDQTGSPTYTPDLAEWSMALAEKRASGIWHAVNSGYATWCELASEAVALAQAPCKIEPIPSEMWPQKAKRPAYSGLDNTKLASFLGYSPRPWQKALRDYLYGYVLKREQAQ